MNLVKTIFLVFTLALMSSCGGAKGPKVIIETLPSAAMASIKIKNNGTTVGFVYSIYQNDVYLYNPQSDRYIVINVETGKYSNTSNAGYFSELDCTGDMVMMGYFGLSNKSVSYLNNKYYLAKDLLGSDFTYRSMYSSGVCTNRATPITWDHNLYRIYDAVEVVRPYDFESISPMSITHE